MPPAGCGVALPAAENISCPVKTIRLAVILLVCAVVLGGLLPPPGQGENQNTYPAGPITYIVAFDPGGQSDREARRQQPYLERILGQKVNIEYRIGSGGAAGWRELVRSKPDGYTIAGFNLPHIILQPRYQNVGYYTDQIVPVAIFQRTPLALAVPARSPFRNVRDFLDYARKQPGVITIGGSGTLSGYHLAVLQLEKLTGCRFTYVPFTGTAPQVSALLAGHVAAIIGASDDVLKYKDKMRVLAFATETRLPDISGAPTFKELGIPLVQAIDRGVAVPAGTPRQVIRRLEEAFLEIVQKPEVQEQMRRQGFVPMAMGHEKSLIYIRTLAALCQELMQNHRR